MKRAHFSFLPLPGTSATQGLLDSGEIKSPNWEDLAYSIRRILPEELPRMNLSPFSDELSWSFISDQKYFSRCCVKSRALTTSSPYSLGREITCLRDGDLLMQNKKVEKDFFDPSLDRLGLADRFGSFLISYGQKP